jgi:hypothetical protein
MNQNWVDPTEIWVLFPTGTGQGTDNDPPPLPYTKKPPSVIYRAGVRAEHRIRTYLEYRFGACTLDFQRRCIHISSHCVEMQGVGGGS